MEPILIQQLEVLVKKEHAKRQRLATKLHECEQLLNYYRMQLEKEKGEAK